MTRVAIRILTVAFAVVGFFTVGVWLLRESPLAQPAPDALNIISSPDGAFKAAVAYWYGGGAISPYCHDQVFVVATNVGDDNVVAPENLVFESECGSFGPKDGQTLNSPLLTWRGDRALVVRFSILNTAAFPATFKLRRLAGNGQVAVEFEAGM